MEKNNIEPKKESKALSFFKRNKLVIIICIFIVLIILLIQGRNFIINILSNNLVSNTRSISGVSIIEDELLNKIGFKDKNLAGDIIKTKDGKFWFFSADKKGCGDSMSCGGYGYMINIENKTVSNFNVHSVDNNVIPVFGSLVITHTKTADDHYKMIIFDPSINKVIDEMEYPIDDERNGILPFYNFLFVSNINYVYTYKDILYSRNIENHISTPIGNFYDPAAVGIDNMDVPMFTSLDGGAIYTLLYLNKDEKRPYSTYPPRDGISPKKDDFLKLIRWEFKDNTSKNITDKNFNYPFMFKFISKDKVLIAGGRSRFGLITYPTYIVNIDTGETKTLFNGVTKEINIDESKINILSSKDINNTSDTSLISFDYNGNFLSKIDYLNEKVVPTKNILIDNSSTRISSYLSE
jgi:hypothetical protein